MATGFESYRLVDTALMARVQQALLQSYFADYEPAFLETPAGRSDVADHVDGRYNRCVDYVLPWLGRYLNLSTADIVELGCGTGSSTAAFAQVARHVSGYDIHAPSVSAARSRLDAMGLRNADLHLVEPAQLLGSLREKHSKGADVFLLYAVLEHQTPAERLETLRTGWEMLRPGGLLVVVDTPNRLVYFDAHTSLLPFFHLLPPELGLPYASRSPRALFRDAMARVPAEDGPITLTRWGLGASYHEVELAIGDCEPLLVGTGFEPEVLEMFPVNLEEELLRFYVEQTGVRVPAAFTRNTLNFVLRKGDNAELISRRSAPPPARYLSVTATSQAQHIQAQAERIRELEQRLSAEPPLRHQLVDQLNSALKQTPLHRQARKLVEWSMERVRRGSR
ncbi:class I SAM-dependent methyltransferase [Pyxidicoccus parkwayensis]|uniref:Class I SAM-dependent methyltransferase n=1 Tax=Pyxidicoccus parkwayensis TaxID=2813578 RepID=A0ABX7P3N7_9BACT|nr:class I SAM-dependent methyltransferase [Pyxidicoccus parkwaysis]QSQ25089.1 class I SAM-dependent methyltransferase [Pyxidicoccus parkwaysis]